MILPDMTLFLADFFDFLDSPIWRAWPFNAGYGEHILPSIARMAFVTLIFGVIILFLRVLFGPKGFLRDEDMDREAEEIIRQEMAELDEEFEKGDMTEMEYKIREKKIKS